MTFPLSIEEIRRWHGGAGTVAFGDPNPATTLIPIWVKYEGRIDVFEDEGYLTVTPIQKGLIPTGSYPNGGKVPLDQVKSIE